MSHSTTDSSSYVLSKYSRSYPTKRIAQGIRSQSQQAPDMASEWQHFTNPIIQLVLDVKSSSKTEIESVRLRIIWKMSSDPEEKNDQADVVFEDLDLLSFSTMMPASSLEGLPLKAVYRDTVVGLRYLYSRGASDAPIYRRFQISFQSSQAALAFINSVRPVCPCKANPVNGNAGAGITQSQRLPPPRAIPSIKAPVLRPSETTAVLPKRNLPLVDTPQTTQTQLSNTHAQPPSRRLLSPVHELLPLSSSPPAHNRSNVSCAVGTNSGPPPDLPSLCTVPLYSQPTSRAHTTLNPLQFDTRPDLPIAGPTSSLPSSSIPLPSSNQSTHFEPSAERRYMTPSGIPALADLQPSSGLFPASVVSAGSLYNLSAEQLELAVIDVIQEDGFIELLEKLFGMWRVKGIIDAS